MVNLMVTKWLRIGRMRNKLLLAFGLLVFSTVSTAKCIKIDWTNSGERADGTLIQTVEKINIYYTLNGLLLPTIPIDGAAITYTTCSIQTGSHIFQLTTVEDGLEGEKSEFLSIDWNGNSPPSKMVITGNNMTIQLIDEPQ